MGFKWVVTDSTEDSPIDETLIIAGVLSAEVATSNPDAVGIDGAGAPDSIKLVSSIIDTIEESRGPTVSTDTGGRIVDVGADAVGGRVDKGTYPVLPPVPDPVPIPRPPKKTPKLPNLRI